MIWVCQGEPRWQIPPFPEYDDPNYRVVPCGPFDWKANAARMIENFNDLGHFAYVHPGLLGDPEHPIVQPYEVQRVGNEIQYEAGVHAANPNAKFRITNLEAGEEPVVRNVYRLIMPFTSHLAVIYPQGGRRVVFSAACPVSDKECRVFSNLGRNFDFHVPDSEIVAWEAKVISQDQAMVESQRPEELPVDLSAEMHIRSDRSAVEYRRWLGELGIEQGSAELVPLEV
jgi:vanillate O-demethylase monooxygenase subunit